MIPEGAVELLVTIGMYPATVVIVTNFLVVKNPCPTTLSTAGHY